jgi:hypothetical protein
MMDAPCLEFTQCQIFLTVASKHTIASVFGVGGRFPLRVGICTLDSNLPDPPAFASFIRPSGN